MYDLEVRDARKRVDKLMAQREQLNSSQNQVETELMATQKALLNAESDLKKLDTRFKSKKDERDALMSEQGERLEKKTQSELIIRDLKEDVERERTGRVRPPKSMNGLSKSSTFRTPRRRRSSG